ncbi:unnamed protein product [Chrysodeixis includens]|uniref:Uncharacterized protein n=1 Tax=Chrysodeixis includens TaxID=689277 RepID=A0A9P0C1F7_CHRIL|nr:unnamed protein product [Chrysodeixis includens]
MLFPKTALLYGILIALLLEPISCRRGFSGGHSYPKSGGLSGGGHRTGGLSGGGHGYPSSGGSHGSHGYPSSGGSHGYPSGGLSGGSHGYPSAGGNRGTSGGNHGYPSSGGLSGSGSGHNYPKQGSGYPSANNYHYTPPQQISYAPSHGAPPVHYPVYRGSPPTYVYQYKDSGSKYGTLLAGLALLNLGTLGAAAYAHSQSSKSHTPIPGEVCKFAVRKDNGDYEETKIDCKIISSFILQDQAEKQHGGSNSTVVTTTTVTNTTTINKANDMPEQTTQPPAAPVAPALGNVLYAMLPNGTLVPVNASGIPIVPGLPGALQNATLNETSTASPNGTMLTSSVVVTTTTTNTTVVDALDVKGAPVSVTPGMKCYVIRNSPTSNMRKSVPCGLLQTYAEKSITKSSAAHNVPMFTMITAILAFCIAY